MIAYFLCLETLTALLLLSRQAGGYQDVVKEVGLEPAIKLAKTALPRASSLAKEALRAYLFVALSKLGDVRE